MRKLYFLLSLLFPIATMMTSSQVQAQTDAEYEAALAAIQDGGKYYITTEYDGYKFYLAADGNLTGWSEEAEITDYQLFTFTKAPGEFKPYGFKVFGTTYFSNPNSSSSLDDTSLHTNGDGREPWEVQIFFLGENGKFAVRATACAATTSTSGWNWCGSSFWTVHDGPSAGYDLNPQYIWQLEVPTQAQETLRVLTGLMDKYGDYVGDDDGFAMNMMEEGGEAEFGQFRDWETYHKFQELMNLIDSYASDKVSAGGCTLDEANAIAAEADSLFDVVLASEQPYVLPNGDGYYRIISPLRYISDASESGYVDKAFIASYLGSSNNMGAYATIQRDHANFLWKLEQHGDSISIENAGMENYISLGCTNRVTLTQDPEDASHVVFDYAGDDYVDADDGNGDTKDLFYIRLASKKSGKRGGSNYIHQLDHNKGNDTGRDMVVSFWVGTYDKGSLDNASDRGTSEWYLEYVEDSEAEEIIANFATLREHDLLVEKNNLLRAQVAQVLETAKELRMITSASQMTSPFSCDNFGYTDGQTLASGALIDGNKETFWHSDYKGNTPEGVKHYIQLSNMKDMVGNCIFYICDRNTTSGNWPSEIALYGSDDPDGDTETWNEIVVFSDLATGALVENTIPFFVETPYRFIRIVCTSNNFWHAAEIQITLTEPRASSQYVMLGEVATNLDDLYNENVDTDNANITEEMYQALLAAYEAFMNEMVDPVELRSAVDAYANLTTSVVEGTNPGEYADTQMAEDYDALLAEVEAYDKGGRYSNAQNHKYAVMLKAMAKSVLGGANTIQTDKWYRITAPTEEMYDAFGFSKEGVDKANDLIEDQWNVYGTIVAPATLLTDSVYQQTEEGEDVLVAQKHLEGVVKDDVREDTRVYFLAEDEIEDEDVSLFRFVEKEGQDADYAALLKDTKENMEMAIDMNTIFVRGDKLITDGSQFSSNASCLNNDGSALTSNCLLDGNTSTYWHTDYQQKILEIPYLQVALNEPISGLVQVEIGRRSGASNGHVVRMYAQGSTDAQNWTNIGYVETPYSGNTSEIVSSQPIDLGGTYSHLRFILTYRYGTDGGGNTEFDPFAEVNGAADWNKKWSYFHCSEFQIYPLTPKTPMSDDVLAVQQALVAANKIVFNDVTAEDVAAAGQVYNAYKDAFNAEAGMTVLPASKEEADPVYAIQNKATGLFIYAYGGKTNDVFMWTIPTLFSWSAPGYRRSMLLGKNFNGDNCTYLHVGESNRRLCTWDSSEARSNSGLYIAEADVEYEAPESFTFYRDAVLGRIHGKTNAVTVSYEAKDDAEAYTCLGRYYDIEGTSFLALKAYEGTIPAGQPSLYIYGDTAMYDSSNDPEPVLYTMPGTPDFVTEETTVNGLISCVKNHTLLPREIYFSGNKPVCVGTTGYFLRAGGVVVDLDNTPRIEDDSEADYLLALGEAGDKADGIENIPATLEKVSQPGNVYSMDGKLLMTGATLNNLKALGRGMYILNGVKVVVK